MGSAVESVDKPSERAAAHVDRQPREWVAEALAPPESAHNGIRESVVRPGMWLGRRLVC
jgi:hypothetical protein